MVCQDYKKGLKSNKVITRSQQKCRTELNKVFTGKINNVVVSVNRDMRIQTPNGIISCPYGIGPETVCNEELIRNPKLKMNIMINFDDITGEHNP